VRLVRRHYRETGQWPTDVYQVLCATCNHGRRVSPTGECPHQGEGVIGVSEQIKQAIFSYLRVFAATILALFLADGADVFAVDALELRTWLAAGVAAVLPVAIRALNPNDGAYGVNAK